MNNYNFEIEIGTKFTLDWLKFKDPDGVAINLTGYEFKLIIKPLNSNADDIVLSTDVNGGITISDQVTNTGEIVIDKLVDAVGFDFINARYKLYWKEPGSEYKEKIEGEIKVIKGWLE